MNNMLNLDEMIMGGIAQRFDHAMCEVLANIQDLNTPINKARKIQLNITLTPTGDSRDTIKFDVQAKTTLVPRENIGTIVLIGVDEDGVVTAKEITKQLPGQIDMAGVEQQQKVRPIAQLK